MSTSRLSGRLKTAVSFDVNRFLFTDMLSTGALSTTDDNFDTFTDKFAFDLTVFPFE